jgi:hypothetical protein
MLRKIEAGRNGLALVVTVAHDGHRCGVVRGLGSASREDEVSLPHAVVLIATREATGIHPDLVNIGRNTLESLFNFKAYQRRLGKCSRTISVRKRDPTQKNCISRHVGARWLWSPAVARQGWHRHAYNHQQQPVEMAFHSASTKVDTVTLFYVPIRADYRARRFGA